MLVTNQSDLGKLFSKDAVTVLKCICRLSMKPVVEKRFSSTYDTQEAYMKILSFQLLDHLADRFHFLINRDAELTQVILWVLNRNWWCPNR